MQPNKAFHIQTKLLAWYDANKRDLPWRRSHQPYEIWISEIMAQQTRITALLPYYERFIKLFPNVQMLAAAPEDDVLKAWEGLGYYSRAKNLHKAAKIIVEHNGGKLPAVKKALLSLPGIGDYTAGAILSIAYGQPEPAIDGNVLRVFARMEENELDITQPQAKTAAADFVRACTPTDRAGCFTQALMELGALICLPKTPLCSECPLYSLCEANLSGHQSLFPVKSAKKPPKQLAVTVLVVFDTAGRILVRQRTEKLLGGLWEYMLAYEALNAAQAESFLVEQGMSVCSLSEIGQANHVFTHLVWNMWGYICIVKEQTPPYGYVWVSKDELKALALPTALKFYTDFIMKE